MLHWISEIVRLFGYGGMAVLLFLENVFPPIPSEMLVPLAGLGTAQGGVSPLGLILAGTLGSTLGSLPLYYLGMKIGEEKLRACADRYGRWLGVSSREIDKTMGWFNRHQGVAILLGRFIPGVRSLISIPAGIVRMNLTSFLLYTAVGSVLRMAQMIYMGFLIGEYYPLLLENLLLVCVAVGVGLTLAGAVWVFYVRKRGCASS